MPGSGVDEEISLGQLVKHWWRLLLLAAVVAGIGGYAVAYALPKSYQSTATVLVGPVNTDVADLDASSSLADTYQSLATTEPVLARAIAATRAHLTPNQLEGSVMTTSNSDTRLVTIAVSNRNPVLAAKLANALAGQVVAIAHQPSPGTNGVLTAFEQAPQVLALNAAQQAAVAAALTSVLGPAPAGRVTVVNPAIPATSPASPRKALIAILGAFAGLLIASLLILGRMSGRPGVADEHAVAELEHTDLGVVEHTDLGVVDISRARDSAEAVSVEARPTSNAAADYRMLAARLSLGESTTRSLLVVDSTDGSAAAVVAANLAAAIARASERSVVLADVSAEHGGATKLLGLEGHEGYAQLIAMPDLEALNGGLSELFVHRGHHVSVLPGGTGELTTTPSYVRARAVLRRLQESADLVVLSGPPVTRSPSGLIWARAAESALFVVDGDKASDNEVMQAIGDMTLANAHFVGTVMGQRRPVWPRLGRAWKSRMLETPRQAPGTLRAHRDRFRS